MVEYFKTVFKTINDALEEINSFIEHCNVKYLNIDHIDDVDIPDNNALLFWFDEKMKEIFENASLYGIESKSRFRGTRRGNINESPSESDNRSIFMIHGVHSCVSITVKLTMDNINTPLERSYHIKIKIVSADNTFTKHVFISK